MRSLCTTIAVIVVLLTSLPGQSSAGILDDFEDDATSKSESDTTSSRGSSDSFADSCLSGCFNSILSSLIEGLFSGGSDDSSEERTAVAADPPSSRPRSVSSSPSSAEPSEEDPFKSLVEGMFGEGSDDSSEEKAAAADSSSSQPRSVSSSPSFAEPSEESYLYSSPETSVSAESLSVQPREIPPGSSVSEQSVQKNFQLPTLYVDLRYESVESNVNAFDGGLEVGYEFFGADFRYTHYVEDDPPDELDVYQWHALLRWAATERFETGVGIGTLTLSGNSSTTGASVTAPVRVTLEAPVAFVFRPSWSWLGDNTVGDYDASVHYLWPNVSAFLGYRWFVSGQSSLDGAVAGVSIRF